MSLRNKLISTTLACILSTALFSISTPSNANDAGAFIGGVFATKLMQNSNRRTRAEEQQAYSSQQPRPVPQTSSSSQSAEQRINELDKLAAGGYITPAEYKTKKKAIIDNM